MAAFAPAAARARGAEADPAEVSGPPRGLWGNAWLQLRRDSLTLAAAGVLLLMVLVAAAADLLAVHFFRYTFSQQDLLNNYAPPTLANPAMWLGSDEYGRSQVVRLLYGARVSLKIAFGAALVNLTIGVLLGLLAGYFRGRVDDLILWAISTLNSVPTVFLLLIVAVLFRPDENSLILTIGLLSWPNITLFVRGQTLSLREREFVTAGRVLGASPARLMFRHILPNVLPLVFVVAAIDVGQIILVESALSFLGFGITPPTPSWGNMLTNASTTLARGPWLVWGPGAAIFLTVLCLYLVGDGLRDALDPRLKH